jgi:hypothetical protein
VVAKSLALLASGPGILSIGADALTLGTVELDEYEDAAAEAVGRLFAHFYTDVKLGRAFNLNAHMILWRFFPPPEDPLPF